MHHVNQNDHIVGAFDRKIVFEIYTIYKIVDLEYKTNHNKDGQFIGISERD